jgi:hypothetical protein
MSTWTRYVLIPPRNPITDYGLLSKHGVGQRVMDAEGNLGTVCTVVSGVVEIFWDKGVKRAKPDIAWKGVEPVFTCGACKQERPWSEGSDDADDYKASLCDTCCSVLASEFTS